MNSLEIKATEQQKQLHPATRRPATRLIEAIAAGNDNLPLSPPDASAQAAAETATKLRVARAELARLDAELAQARDRRERCVHGVARCAVNVLLDEAISMAEAILVAEAELANQRADLDHLAQFSQ